MVDNLNITCKTIQVGEDIEFPSYETRYFAESNDGFDGTAQGYGYKSKQKLILAHWYFLNKNKIPCWNNEAKSFLKKNPDIKTKLKQYFSEDNFLYAWKCQEELSMQSFVNELLKDEDEKSKEIAQKLNQVKRLWKSFMEVL